MTENLTYLAKLPNLPDSPENVESIQLFPPGDHAVTVTNAKGAPVELNVTITAATADVLETSRATYQAAADAGTGDAPYFDFNHDDREASAWVKAIYWAGDDPQTGGVRAKVELSEAGKNAIAGKTFRRFSPSFHSTSDGRITGAPPNMGGFVNRAAFRTIAPLFAKQSTDEKSTTTTMMTEEEIKLITDENTALKSELETLKKSLEEMNRKDAEKLVDAAAKEGKIACAPELKAKWVESIVKDPAAAELLHAMAPHPALAAGSVVQGKAADTSETPEVLLAKFNALPRAERDTFYATHRAALNSLRK